MSNPFWRSTGAQPLGTVNPTSHFAFNVPNEYQHKDTWGALLNENWTDLDDFLWDHLPRDGSRNMTGLLNANAGISTARASAIFYTAWNTTSSLPGAIAGLSFRAYDGNDGVSIFGTDNLGDSASFGELARFTRPAIGADTGKVVMIRDYGDIRYGRLAADNTWTSANTFTGALANVITGSQFMFSARRTDAAAGSMCGIRFTTFTAAPGFVNIEAMDNAGASLGIAGRLDPAGPTTSAASVLMTREKGDARYTQTALLVTALVSMGILTFAQGTTLTTELAA